MAEAILLSDVLKSAQAASSVSGLSLVSVNSQGEPKKLAPVKLQQGLMNVDTIYIRDLNEATTPGVWLLSGDINPANSPEGFSSVVGIVEVFQRYTRIFQRVMGYDCRMALRIGTQNGNDWDWKPWHVM